jgi:hypothetical protein
MTSSDKDLKDVLREERSRGRKQPVSTKAEQEAREREEAALEAIEDGPDAVRDLLRLWGVPESEIEKRIAAIRKSRPGF